ncbi:CLUMA_CG011774, isoform A [Clunio marinus]|uniref:CLUMA_CG011774, isoform A n=1 Tax=Clunio marinus TaxID=568069 RepID=A0A1J1IDX1_9DIPT|nr:CLUMA_CG011774, isoform A [Clunio marinus]
MIMSHNFQENARKFRRTKLRQISSTSITSLKDIRMNRTCINQVSLGFEPAFSYAHVSHHTTFSSTFSP